MQCDICSKKKATVHLTEIVDEQITELHLCEDCAREKSLQMEQQFGLADLLAGLTDFGKQTKNAQQVKVSCHACGLGYDDFRKLGRLGCSECYVSFKDHLGLLLKKIHGSNKHYGKSPTKIAKPAQKTVSELERLREQLRQAIDVEDFEQAAKLRDKIHELESKESKKKG